METCPLEGKCQIDAIVYKATVTASDGEVKTYTGCTDRTFKQRHYGHMSDFKNRENRNNSKLAGYVREKKDGGVAIDNVKWEVIKKCHKYHPGGDMCDVCLTEKLSIMKNKAYNSLNKRHELMNSCRHRRRYKLAFVKGR